MWPADMPVTVIPDQASVNCSRIFFLTFACLGITAPFPLLPPPDRYNRDFLGLEEMEVVFRLVAPRFQQIKAKRKKIAVGILLPLHTDASINGDFFFFPGSVCGKRYRS